METNPLEKIASLLNRRQYRAEVTPEIKKIAKDNWIVIIYWASDDLMEIDWAIRDEAGCNNESIICMTKNWIFEDCEDECEYSKKAKESCKTIKTLRDNEWYSWTYKTDIPHLTFEILEDEYKYCRWIVFFLKDL